jgi:hypothetical protein
VTRSRHPRLVIELRLEEHGRAFLHADTADDERRLLAWLAGSGVRAELDRLLARLLAESPDQEDAA